MSATSTATACQSILVVARTAIGSRSSAAIASRSIGTTCETTSAAATARNCENCSGAVYDRRDASATAAAISAIRASATRSTAISATSATGKEVEHFAASHGQRSSCLSAHTTIRARTRISAAGTIQSEGN
jgi:hypothetical protein